MIRRIVQFVGRILGLVLVLIGIVGIGLAVAMGVIGTRGVTQLTGTVYGSLVATSDGLGTVEDTLEQLQATLSSVNDLVDTAGETAVDLGGTLDATGASVDRVAEIAATEMPAIFESLGTVVGELATATETIDVAMTTLYQVSGGLIDFTAAIPSTESALDLQDSLSSLALEVRALAADLSQVSESTAPVSKDTVVVSEELAAINDNLRGFAPIVDEYIELVGDVQGGLDQAKASLPRVAQIANVVIIVLAVWLGALHVAPLVQGWELIVKRRAEREQPAEAAAPRDDEGEPGSERTGEPAAQGEEEGEPVNGHAVESDLEGVEATQPDVSAGSDASP